MSDEIDKDAIDVLGINPDVWRKYRGMTDPKYIQDDLPGFLKAEAEARESGIDKWETVDRLSKFFCNMDKCKDPKVMPLCRQQKKALMKYFTAEYRNGQKGRD